MKSVHPGREKLYGAAELFVEEALVKDGSLFTPGNPIWSKPVLDDLHRRFVEQPDRSKDSFEVKFQRQLSGAPAETYQLAAEIMFVHVWVAGDFQPKTKRRAINNLLNWSPSPVTIPTQLDEVLEQGLVNSGVAFKTYKPFQLMFILEFARIWKSLGSDDQERGLSDPWFFKDITERVGISRARSQQLAFLHLVHPNSFEPIISRDHKIAIARTFRDRIPEPADDIDQLLHQIRQHLTPTFGETFNFYRPEIKTQWTEGKKIGSTKDKTKLWDTFGYWVTRFAEDGLKPVKEFNLEVAASVSLAKEAVIQNGPDWLESIRKAMNQAAGKLLFFGVTDSFRKWCEIDRENARDALLELWNESLDLSQAIERFNSRIQDGDIPPGPGTRLSLITLLLSGVDASLYPIYKDELQRKVMRRAGLPLLTSQGSLSGMYQSATGFWDRMVDDDSFKGIDDRLDARCACWCVINLSDKPGGWTESQWNQLLQYRSSGSSSQVDEVTDDESSPRDLSQLAERLTLDEEFLVMVSDLLADKRQIVLYGPPGTGKTFIARELASTLAGSSEAVRLVQFHPSYSYEDFIQGYRPRSDEGGGFRLVDGPLMRMAKQAEANHDTPHFLIIDEINRGNVAKVFGELYFLLEYRGEFVELQYSDESFSLPENLFIIGTMNTADRSIALIDAALRRRFHFVGLNPHQDPIRGLLRRWLTKNVSEMTWVADIVDVVNRELDRHGAIGPSHFMKPDLDDEKLALIWKYSVLPYLEEVYYGQEERLTEFELERLIAGPETIQAAPDDHDAD